MKIRKTLFTSIVGCSLIAPTINLVSCGSDPKVEQVSLTYKGINCKINEAETRKINKGTKFSDIHPEYTPNEGFVFEGYYKSTTVSEENRWKNDDVISSDSTVVIYCKSSESSHIEYTKSTKSFNADEYEEKIASLTFSSDVEINKETLSATIVEAEGPIEIKDVGIEFTSKNTVAINVKYSTLYTYTNDQTKFAIRFNFKNSTSSWTQKIGGFTLEYTGHITNIIIKEGLYAYKNAQTAKNLDLYLPITEKNGLDIDKVTVNMTINSKKYLEIDTSKLTKQITTIDDIKYLLITVPYTSASASEVKAVYSLSISYAGDNPWSVNYEKYEINTLTFITPKKSVIYLENNIAGNFEFDLYTPLQNDWTVKVDYTETHKSSEYCKGVKISNPVISSDRSKITIPAEFIEGFIGKDCIVSFKLKFTISDGDGKELWSEDIYSLSLVYKGPYADIDTSEREKTFYKNENDYIKFDADWNLTFNDSQVPDLDKMEISFYASNPKATWKYESNAPTLTKVSDNVLNVKFEFNSNGVEFVGGTSTECYGVILIKDKTSEWTQWTSNIHLVVNFIR